MTIIKKQTNLTRFLLTLILVISLQFSQTSFAQSGTDDIPDDLDGLIYTTNLEDVDEDKGVYHISKLKDHMNSDKHFGSGYYEKMVGTRDLLYAKLYKETNGNYKHYTAYTFGEGDRHPKIHYLEHTTNWRFWVGYYYKDPSTKQYKNLNAAEQNFVINAHKNSKGIRHNHIKYKLNKQEFENFDSFKDKFGDGGRNEIFSQGRTLYIQSMLNQNGITDKFIFVYDSDKMDFYFQDVQSSGKSGIIMSSPGLIDADFFVQQVQKYLNNQSGPTPSPTGEETVVSKAKEKAIKQEQRVGVSSRRQKKAIGSSAKRGKTKIQSKSAKSKLTKRSSKKTKSDVTSSEKTKGKKRVWYNPNTWFGDEETEESTVN